MSPLFPMLPGLLALGRDRDHGAQAGGSQHQRATKSRDGFMSKKQARQLDELVRLSRVASDSFYGVIPAGSLDFRKPFDASQVEIDPGLALNPINRAADFAAGPALYSLTARPGWFVSQVPRDGITYLPFQSKIAPVSSERTIIVPFFADLPQNVIGAPNIHGVTVFGIGQTLGSTIDGSNIIFCQIGQWGGNGALPDNSWSIDFTAMEGGGLVHSEPQKMATGAPPVAVVFVRHADRWHVEVLCAGNTPAHVSQEFLCDITPDRFGWGAMTQASADHALVRGVQGVYQFNTDGLVL